MNKRMFKAIMTQLARIQVEVFVLREIISERLDSNDLSAVVQQRIDQLWQLQLQQVDRAVDDIMPKAQVEPVENESEFLKQFERFQALSGADPGNLNQP